MNKNYYEILEINRNASQEIVEKAYKTLAKKYHPDLQSGNNKIKYEEKLKAINEAYEVLSDPQKRASYDTTLPDSVSAEEYKNLYRQKEYMKKRITHLEREQQANNNQPRSNYYGTQNPNAYDEDYINRVNEEYQKQVNSAINKAYHDAYVQDLKNRGYKIRYKKTLKDYISILLTIFVVIFVFVILWYIPPVQNYLKDLYNTNSVIHFLVDLVFKLFNIH